MTYTQRSEDEDLLFKQNFDNNYEVIRKIVEERRAYCSVKMAITTQHNIMQE